MAEANQGQQRQQSQPNYGDDPSTPSGDVELSNLNQTSNSTSQLVCNNIPTIGDDENNSTENFHAEKQLDSAASKLEIPDNKGPRKNFEWQEMSPVETGTARVYPDPTKRSRIVYPSSNVFVPIIALNFIIMGYMVADLCFTLMPWHAAFRNFFNVGALQAIELAVAVIIFVVNLYNIGGMVFDYNRHRHEAQSVQASKSSSSTSYPSSVNGGIASGSRGMENWRKRDVAHLALIIAVAFSPMAMAIALSALHKYAKVPPIIRPPSICETMGFKSTLNFDASNLVEYPSTESNVRNNTNPGQYTPSQVFIELSSAGYEGNNPITRNARFNFSIGSPYTDPSKTGVSTGTEGIINSFMLYTASPFASNSSIKLTYEYNNATDLNTYVRRILFGENEHQSKNVSKDSYILDSGTWETRDRLFFPTLYPSLISNSKDWRSRLYNYPYDFELVEYHNPDKTAFKVLDNADKQMPMKGKNTSQTCIRPVLMGCARGDIDSDETLIPAGILLTELWKLRRLCEDKKF